LQITLWITYKSLGTVAPAMDQPKHNLNTTWTLWCGVLCGVIYCRGWYWWHTTGD